MTRIKGYGSHTRGGTGLLTFVPLYFVCVEVVSGDVAIERGAGERFCIGVKAEIGDCCTVLLVVFDLEEKVRKTYF
jgi:hypothetical protein